MIQQRKKRNSSKVNLIISVIFHSTLVLAVFFFAAREGMLGKKLKQITVTMVQGKETRTAQGQAAGAEDRNRPRPAEAPKPAVPPPRWKPPPPRRPLATPRPQSRPPPSPCRAFEFSDGAKEVQSHLRSHWDLQGAGRTHAAFALEPPGRSGG